MRRLLCLLLPLWTALAGAVEPELRFESIGPDEGLPQASVHALASDARGFLWLGTQDGLTRFDGIDFKVLRKEPDNPNGLTESYVSALFADAQQQLWIGAQSGGLNRYDLASGEISQYVHRDEEPGSLINNGINAIASDARGRLWIGTDGGLDRYDPNSGSFVHVALQAADSDAVEVVHALHQDRDGELWIGGSSGLHRLRLADDRVIRIELPGLPIRQGVSSLTADADGQLWLGTNGAGLWSWQAHTQELHQVQPRPGESWPATQAFVWSLLSDRAGRLWAATSGGLLMRSSAAESFRLLQHVPANRHSLVASNSLSLLEDARGAIWIGTLAGLSQFEPATLRFHHYRHDPADPNSLSHDWVRGFAETDDGRLWVAGAGGLASWDASQRRFARHARPQADPAAQHPYVHSLATDDHGVLWIGGEFGLDRLDPKHDVREPFDPPWLPQDLIAHGRPDYILPESDGSLWIGTWRSGLIHVDSARQRYMQYLPRVGDPNSLPHANVRVVRRSRDGTLWVGTWGGGLCRLRAERNDFHCYRRDPADPNSLGSDAVLAIHEDASERLWLATQGAGLVRFERKTGQFRAYTRRDGLANDALYAVLEDDAGYLWVSHNAGLSRFDPRTQQVRNFSQRDGLQADEFNNRAYYKSHSGELFFGGIRGFNRFFPRDIVDDATPPPVVLTDFLLFNKSVPIGVGPGNGFALPNPIDVLGALTLSHRESLVSFEFAALDFRDPARNRYAYRLVGFDQDWIETDARNRRATYTSLPAGRYTLRVKAANAAGVWNEEGVALAIEVLPPPWRSGWAYAAYALLLTLAAAGAWRLRERRLRERLAVASLQRVNQLKDEFLANTSHELRTPLNGMVGLAQALLAQHELPASARAPLELIIASGRRLANLINDILDFTKLKQRSLQLYPRPLDLNVLVDGVLALTRPLLGSKPIELINTVATDLPTIVADEARLQQILLNLVGNAVKFTDRGRIEVGVDAREPLRVFVRDSGIGIPRDKQTAIFEYFEQVDGSNERSHGGSGLGLAVTRQLVELHGGQIEVESAPGAGSCFRFTLPLAFTTAPLATLGAATPQQPASEDWAVDLLQATERRAPRPSPDRQFEPTLQRRDGEPYAVLAVDDEAINREVLQALLADQPVTLTLAEDGASALALLEQQRFDLVLLDVMLPKLSGYEVCRRIRAAHSALQLPVLLLTAKHRVEDLAEGLAAGANDFLHKPIARTELFSRMNTQLQLCRLNAEALAAREAQLRGERERDELLVRERLALAHQLTAGLAHEINNPVGFAALAAQNLGEEHRRFREFLCELAGQDAEPEVLAAFDARFARCDEQLATILEGNQRVAAIVADLRTISRLDPAQATPTRIVTLLQATIRLVGARYKQGIEFSVRIDADPPIRCLPARLNQVFMNLLVNACHATEARAATAEAGYRGRIDVVSEQRDDWLWLRFSDNGCGIAMEWRERIFEAFFTTKAEGGGTGLGLAVSLGVVRELGGRIEVESQLGQGSCFSVVLPVVANESVDSFTSPR